jgi:hypothetical protein
MRDIWLIFSLANLVIVSCTSTAHREHARAGDDARPAETVCRAAALGPYCAEPRRRGAPCGLSRLGRASKEKRLGANPRCQRRG